MMTVKAVYDNGTVKWERKPQVSGLHNLIVVFEDVECEPTESASETKTQTTGTSWRGFKELIGCVAERADGADRHDDYLTKADAGGYPSCGSIQP